MAQTSEGAKKIAALKTGVSVELYEQLTSQGLKWCSKGRHWSSTENFARDKSRYDGLSAKCLECTRVKFKKSTKGRPSAFRGRKHSAEARAKMSLSRKGKPGPKRGIPRPDDVRQKISDKTKERTPRGESHYAWKGGAKARLIASRRDYRYRWWREAVFNRDKFACQKCGDNRGGNLRAHHIKPFAAFPELRFDVTNGVTLCHVCHELEHFKPESIRNQRKLKRGERLWM